MHEGILVALNRPSAETRIAIIETFVFAGDMPCICGLINNFHWIEPGHSYHPKSLTALVMA